MTLALGLQYGALVLYPATHDGNPERSFVYGLTLLGLAAAFVVELVFARFRPRWGQVKRINVHIAGGIALVGAAAELVGYSVGLGVYGSATVSSASSGSHFGALLTPFQTWPIIGLVLAIYSWRNQPRDHKWVLAYTAVTVLVTLAIAILSAATGPLYSLLLVLGVAAALGGMFRAWWLILFIILLTLAWPTLYTIRNQARAKTGAVSFAYATAAGAQTRLDFDQLMAQAPLAKSAGVSIPGIPSWGLVIRSGLVPRALDRNRPDLNTGTQINVALTGSSGSVDYLHHLRGTLVPLRLRRLRRGHHGHHRRGCAARPPSGAAGLRSLRRAGLHDAGGRGGVPRRCRRHAAVQGLGQS